MSQKLNIKCPTCGRTMPIIVSDENEKARVKWSSYICKNILCQKKLRPQKGWEVVW